MPNHISLMALIAFFLILPDMFTLFVFLEPNNAVQQPIEAPHRSSVDDTRTIPRHPVEADRWCYDIDLSFKP